MKACCLALTLFIWGSSALQAQPGRAGFGIRGTIDGAGFTTKYFLNKGVAIEGQLNVGGQRALNGRSIYSCALIEYHLALPFPDARLYFGGGLHAGWWASRPDAKYEDEIMAGLSGIGGVEFLLRHVPLGFSGDLRPSINYVQEVEFLTHNLVGVSVRYYFGSDKVKPFVYPWRIRRKFR